MFNHTSKNIEFINACFNNNVHKVREMLDSGGVDINTKNYDKYTIFIIACRFRYMEIIKLLLRYKELDINAKNFLGHSAFTTACCYGSVEVVKLLLENKNVDINSTTNEGYTGYMLSCFYGYKEIIKLLINDNRMNIHIKNDKGNDGFIIACVHSRIDIVKLLIANDKVSSIIDAYMKSCFNRNREVIKLLFLYDHNLYKYDTSKYENKSIRIIDDDILEFISNYIKSKEYNDSKMRININKGSDIFSLSVLLSDNYYTIKN